MGKRKIKCHNKSTKTSIESSEWKFIKIDFMQMNGGKNKLTHLSDNKCG